MTDNQAHSAERGLLWIFGVVLLVFGAVGLLIPGQLLGGVDIALASPTAAADVRALYGGLPLGIDILFLYARRDPSWLAPALALGMASTGGPALGRLYSIAASGMPNRLVLIYLGAEIAGFLYTSWLFWRVTGGRRRALATAGGARSAAKGDPG